MDKLVLYHMWYTTRTTHTYICHVWIVNNVCKFYDERMVAIFLCFASMHIRELEDWLSFTLLFHILFTSLFHLLLLFFVYIQWNFFMRYVHCAMCPTLYACDCKMFNTVLMTSTIHSVVYNIRKHFQLLMWLYHRFTLKNIHWEIMRSNASGRTSICKVWIINWLHVCTVR